MNYEQEYLWYINGNFFMNYEQERKSEYGKLIHMVRSFDVICDDSRILKRKKLFVY